MMTRVATYGGSRSTLANIQRSFVRLDRAQEQVVTGKRVNRVSDNPTDGVSSVINRTLLKRLEQYERNATEADAWLLANDSALADSATSLISARSRLVQVGGAPDAVARKAIADELRATAETMIGTANSTKAGRQIFSGTADVATAYALDGSYLGNATPVTIPVFDSIAIRVDRTGPEVFGVYDAGDPSAGNIFQQLRWMADEIEAGNVAVAASGLGTIDHALERLATAQVELGTRHAQLESIQANIAGSKVSTTAAISKNEDVDAAEAIMNWRTRQSAYESALKVSAQTMQQSLLDFIR